VGVSINPTNGILNWAPGLSYGSTTNYIQVIIADSQTQSSPMIETLVVTVGAIPTGDYLVLSLPTTAVQAGQFATVPVCLNSSAGATNLLFTFAWPANALTNVSLTLNDPNLSGAAFAVNGILNVEISNGSIAAGSSHRRAGFGHRFCAGFGVAMCQSGFQHLHQRGRFRFRSCGDWCSAAAGAGAVGDD
jgi:hypothetical protein